MRALSGPAAAQLLELDGFREGVWKQMWCSPHGVRPQPGVVRTRSWESPTFINSIPVASPALVLRHLADEPLNHLVLSDHELVEMALEHALRDGLVSKSDLGTQGAKRRGERILRDVLRMQPQGEPPTESYAETRAVQVFRPLGFVPWRQVEVFERGRLKHRVDFMIPVPLGRRRRPPRPNLIVPSDGLLVKIDSAEWHAGTFERDHERQSVYDRMGFHWISLTPKQIEAEQVGRSLNGALRRMVGGRTLQKSHEVNRRRGQDR